MQHCLNQLTDMPPLKLLSIVLMKQLTTQHLPQAEIIGASCLCGEPSQCVFFYLLHFITTWPEIANLITDYFVLSKVYTDGGGKRYLYHGLSDCTGNNPLPKARGLSPRAGGRNVIILLHIRFHVKQFKYYKASTGNILLDQHRDNVNQRWFSGGSKEESRLVHLRLLYYTLTHFEITCIFLCRKCTFKCTAR